MENKESGALRGALNDSWDILIKIILTALIHLSETGSQVYTFWSGRGGGKSTFLDLVGQKLSIIPDIHLLGKWDIRRVTFDQLSIEVLSALENAPKKQKKVVLLDDLDSLLRKDENDFFGFERKVIHSLLEEKGILIIATSNIQIKQWREYEVRIKHSNFQIPALTINDIRPLAIQWRRKPEEIYAISLGYPLVLEWLQNNPKFSEKDVAKKYSSYFFNDLPADIVQLAKTACLLPTFNVAILRLLLASGNNTGKTESLYAEYLGKIRYLMGTGLIHWDADIGAYRFIDNVIRRLLARSILYENSVDFHNIHVVAAQYFQNEARRASYLQYSFVSALYHLAQSHRDKKSTEVGEICRNWVKEKLSTWVGADWEAVSVAWRTGANDLSIIEELKDLIGLVAYIQITQLLEEVEQNPEVVS